MSLLGDSLGHAVLPGLCLGFMVTWTKHPVWLFAGALMSALLAGGLIAVIQRGTRLKPDVGMGLVLSGFFGVGLMILSRIQSTQRGGAGRPESVLLRSGGRPAGCRPAADWNGDGSDCPVRSVVVQGMGGLLFR